MSKISLKNFYSRNMTEIRIFRTRRRAQFCSVLHCSDQNYHFHFKTYYCTLLEPKIMIYIEVWAEIAFLKNSKFQKSLESSKFVTFYFQLFSSFFVIWRQENIKFTWEKVRNDSRTPLRPNFLPN